MKLKNKIAVIYSFVFMLTVGLLAQSVPSLINYQGRLTDANGAALPMGSYGIEFRLWDSPTNQTGLVWGQRQNVNVQANGVFNVILGAPGGGPITNPVPAVNDLAVAFSTAGRYLGVTITSSNGVSISIPAEIVPRQQLMSVPFAVMSQQVANAVIGSQQIADGTIEVSDLAQRVAEALVPPGTIVPFGGTNVPNGWLLCDGKPYGRIGTYSRLSDAIGVSWGQGNGSTTFNVPDLRGFFLRGVDDTGGRDPDRGSRTNIAGTIVGSAVGSYQPDTMAAHTHNINDNFGSSHVISAGRKYAEAETVAPDLHPTTTQSAILGNTETRPKNAYVNYIIKY